MSSFSLRLLALTLMAADHAALALFPALGVLRLTGRASFPLYCFLLSQGYAHTHNVRAYACRLLLFAVLSEIPFDLLIFGRLVSGEEQNALFALLLGLLTLFAADALQGRPFEQAAAVLALLVFAMLVRVSYGWLGPALCLCFHRASGKPRRMLCGAGALLLLYTLSLWLSGVSRAWALASLFALLALLPIAHYNGRRGQRTPALTFLFYAFYPVHLLVLCALRAAHIVSPFWFA